MYDFVNWFRNPGYKNMTDQCLNEKGQYQQVYKFKCQKIYRNMMKSTTDLFDNNYLSNQNKAIYISNYHEVEEYEDDYYVI